MPIIATAFPPLPYCQPGERLRAAFLGPDLLEAGTDVFARVEAAVSAEGRFPFRGDGLLLDGSARHGSCHECGLKSAIAGWRAGKG